MIADKSKQLSIESLYINEASRYPLLSSKEERYYSTRAQQGDLHARNKMICCNLRLVIKYATFYVKKHPDSPLEFLDYVEEGNLGLFHAIRKFDPDKGCKFSTYAVHWIRDYMLGAQMDNYGPWRMPRDKYKKLKSCLYQQRVLEKELHRKPSDSELAEKTGTTIDELHGVLCLNQRAPAMTSGGDGDDAIDTIVQEVGEKLQNSTDDKDLALFLERCRCRLTGNKSDVLQRRFGMDGYEAETLEHVGEDIGIPRENVRLTQLQALKDMRVILEQLGVNLETLPLT